MTVAMHFAEALHLSAGPSARLVVERREEVETDTNIAHGTTRSRGAPGAGRCSSAADGGSLSLASARHGAHVGRSTNCRAAGGRA